MGNQRKKAPKHKDPVLLGLPDGAIESSDDVDAYITKIGGVPVSPKTLHIKIFSGFDSMLYCFRYGSTLRNYRHPRC